MNDVIKPVKLGLVMVMFALFLGVGRGYRLVFLKTPISHMLPRMLRSIQSCMMQKANQKYGAMRKGLISIQPVLWRSR